MLSRPIRPIITVHLDDLALKVAKSLSGLKHFVIGCHVIQKTGARNALDDVVSITCQALAVGDIARGGAVGRRDRPAAVGGPRARHGGHTAHGRACQMLLATPRYPTHVVPSFLELNGIL